MFLLFLLIEFHVRPLNCGSEVLVVLVKLAPSVGFVGIDVELLRPHLITTLCSEICASYNFKVCWLLEFYGL